jgi:ABC-type nitrate/sulfonate/bicarbonate transport system substrate-binding protein
MTDAPTTFRTAPLPGHRAITTALCGVASLVLAACGASEPEDGQDASGTSSDATIQLNVGYFPLLHTATIVHADEAGLFEAEGLDVELTQTGGGAQAIPPLIAGEYDVTYSNYTSALLAVQQGLPLRIASGNDVGADDQAIMVAANSSFKEPGDLAGARIAVNTLKNIGTVAISAVLEEAGVDPSTIQFVELPFPDMAPALTNGDVDAIWQVEPFRSLSLSAGHRILFSLFVGPVKDMPVAGWVTTAEFARENPEALARFQRAIAASVEDLQADRETVVELVPTYTQVPAAVLADAALPVWTAEVDAEQLQKLADLMERYAIIDEPFDVSSILLDR